MNYGRLQYVFSKPNVLGIVLSIGVFVFMSIILKPLPFPGSNIAQLQGAHCCTDSDNFWFAYNMFMLVLSDQIKQRKTIAINKLNELTYDLLTLNFWRDWSVDCIVAYVCKDDCSSSLQSIQYLDLWRHTVLATY